MNTDEMVVYCSSKSNESLAFIVKDCREAVQAMPNNERAIEYLLLASEAERQLTRRGRLSQWRRTLRENGFDPLAVANGYLDTYRARHWSRKNISDRNKTPYTKDRIRSALWILGSYRRFGLV